MNDKDFDIKAEHVCGKFKQGEYDLLYCCDIKGHDGGHCYFICSDKMEQAIKRRAAAAIAEQGEKE